MQVRINDGAMTDFFILIIYVFFCLHVCHKLSVRSKKILLTLSTSLSPFKTTSYFDELTIKVSFFFFYVIINY